MSKFTFVLAERGNHAVAMLCRVIGASVSGFYAWLHAIPAVQGRAEAEAELRGHIGRVFAAGCLVRPEHGRTEVYGSPRVHAELRREGRRHARRRVERLMREMEPVRTAGPAAGAPDYGQPPRTPGRPQLAGPRLHRGEA